MHALTFREAFNYPFKRPIALLNILIILIPILGGFVIGGYGVRIGQAIMRGETKELPKLDFGDCLKLGFMMFLKAIPFALVISIIFGILIQIDLMLYAIVVGLAGLFLFPILGMNFIKKETVSSLFEVGLIKPVFANFGDYIMVILKSIALGIVWIILMIVLVGIPASTFTQNIFMADFYRRAVLKPSAAPVMETPAM
ncbi:DUF4013 domain-containing protein [Candidatus Peregrinibacteria bacterium]|nr:DUF4013 domain-containing protein [Candidatus Peregrinibacteria bacterium]